MIASIHQPHFFPWLGYFHKIINSDVFVLLDDVQFEKNYFQNRTQIKNLKGESCWFGVQVQKAPLATPINQIQISPVFKPNSLLETLKQYYRKAPYFNDYFNHISNILLEDNKSLLEINYNSIKYLFDLFSINNPIFISSELNILDNEPNSRLIKICQKLSADTYLAGKGGRKYMNTDMFNNNNIDVKWQDFKPELIHYQQINGGFISGLSVLDALFNIGHEKVIELLKNNH